jgi:plastocyanin
VNVAIFDFGFTLSQTTVPCGQVTFVVVNTGQVFHNFDVEVPVANGRQGFLGSRDLLGGETETQTASYTRTGLYRYQCDLHWVQGQMIGVLTVTQ